MMKKLFIPILPLSNPSNNRYFWVCLLLAVILLSGFYAKAQNSDIDPGEILGGSNNPLVYHRICTGDYKFDDILSIRAGKSKTGKKIYYTWFVEVPGKAKKALALLGFTPIGYGESILFSKLNIALWLDFDDLRSFGWNYENTKMPNQLKLYRGAHTTLGLGKIEDCVFANPITFALTPEDKVTGGGGEIEISNYTNKCAPVNVMLKSLWIPVFSDGQAKWQSSTDTKTWRDATSYSPVNKVIEGYRVSNLGQDIFYRRVLKSNKSGCKQDSYSNEVKVTVIPKPVITTENNIVLTFGDVNGWGAIKYLTASPTGGVFEHVSGIGKVYRLFASNNNYLLSLSGSDLSLIKTKPRNATVSYVPNNACANSHKTTKTFAITYLPSQNTNSGLSTNGIAPISTDDLSPFLEKMSRKAIEGFEFESNESNAIAYPNPVTDELTLKYYSEEEGGSLHIDVIDMSGVGQLNLKQTTRRGLNLIKLDVSQLQSGTYNIKLVQGNTITNTKIVKSK